MVTKIEMVAKEAEKHHLLLRTVEKNDAGVKFRVHISSPMGVGVPCILKSSHT